MKSYEIFAIYKLKMWITVEVVLIVMTLSLIGLDIAIVGISQEYRNLFFTAVFLVLLVLLFIIFYKDTKSYSLCKKAKKDKNAVLKKGKFIRAVGFGFYQTIEVEVDGEKIEVTPKIPSWSYNDYYRVNHDEVALMLSDGKYFLLEERIIPVKCCYPYFSDTD